MNKIIILNRSLGELDWIITNYAYLVSKPDSVTFLCYRMDVNLVLSFAPNFFKQNDLNIISCDEYVKYSKLLKKIDDILDRASTFIFNKFGSKKQYQFDSLFVTIKKFISKAFNFNFEFEGETLHHENNDRTTCFLELIKSKSKPKKIIFFPHHFGATQPVNDLTHKIQRKIGVNSCYVNFDVESGVGVYEYCAEKAMKNLEKNDAELTVLILTRPCSDAFAFSYQNAYSVLDRLLSQIDKKSLEIHIKNHPREVDNPYWGKLVENYNLNVVTTSTLDFVVGRNVICFHLHTSLCIPLSKMGVRCYDVSPYEVELLMHNEPLKTQLELQKKLGSTNLVDNVHTVDFCEIFR